MTAIMPTCPGGHTMRIQSASTLRGSGRVWSAWCACPCGWVGPRVNSTTQELAENKAVELAGGGVLPDDHIMTDTEVKNFVRKHIAR